MDFSISVSLVLHNRKKQNTIFYGLLLTNGTNNSAVLDEKIWNSKKQIWYLCVLRWGEVKMEPCLDVL